MLPYRINNDSNITPDTHPAEWRRGIQHEFSNQEYHLMRYQSFWFLPDALARCSYCKSGRHFVLFERGSQKIREVIYVAEYCSKDQLVYQSTMGAEPVTISGDALRNYLILFVNDFSEREYQMMNDQGFSFLKDAVEDCDICKPGEYFILFERNSQSIREMVYVVESCSNGRLVCKPFEGTEIVTFTGDELNNYLIVFVVDEGASE